MAASFQTIRGWFREAESKGAAYMVVVCDTYDHEDYPIHCEDADEARAKVSAPGEMQGVMEVYDVALGWDAQSVGRVWNLPAKDGSA